MEFEQLHVLDVPRIASQAQYVVIPDVQQLEAWRHFQHPHRPSLRAPPPPPLPPRPHPTPPAASPRPPSAAVAQPPVLSVLHDYGSMIVLQTNSGEARFAEHTTEGDR